MGDREKRKTSSLNYRRFHETGEKVHKVVSKIDPVDKLSQSFGSFTLGMSDSVKFKQNVSVLSSKIEEFQCSNDLDTFDEIDEVKEYVSEAVLLKQELYWGLSYSYYMLMICLSQFHVIYYYMQMTHV